MSVELTNRQIVATDQDVVQLTFARADGVELPRWQPGCHLDVYLPSGRQRSYSLCGDPQDRHTYRIAVRRIPAGGGGSRDLHALPVGTMLSISHPRNGFPFQYSPRALFIAGGIGVTPILPMVRAAQRLHMDWRFVYCGRSEDSLPFLPEITTWDPQRTRIRLDDEHGLPTAADLLGTDLTSTAVYVCGPPPMIESVRTMIDDTDAVAFHFERFSAAPVVDGTAFELQFASTGEIVEVSANETLLDVVRKHRPNVGYSCQQGFCGTCKTRVLAGTPDHRDHRLSVSEQADSMLICVSRARSDRLVLDL
ncbi:PDR/VanB family oxidoreductase [Nocardia sp. NPDC020380]|uniref:PDR/VanB family oxidoreductase n=1 Tax=Nocardia sp. NPDC020380 TaxID=3364309 RepID=UPI0037A5B064